MRSASLKSDEEVRLATLAEYDALHDKLDPRLDEVVELARRLFDVPIALVSLVDFDRQVFAARSGLDACETGRRESFCAHALGGDDILVVPDARADPRFVDNPLVVGEPHIRFYAGVPLRTSTGYDIGTLCIIDRAPRHGLSAQDRRSLRDLGRLVMDQFEMRRMAVAGRSTQRRFQSIAATSPDAIVCADHEGRLTFWNDTASQLFGYSANEAIGANIDIIVPPHMRGGHSGGLHRVAHGGEARLVGQTVELDALHRDGRVFPIELSLSMWNESGHASFGAIMRDISERRRTQDRLYRLAHQDWLTALPNRGALLDRMREAIGRGEAFSLLVADIDRFKEINDALGHGVGDEVLKQISARMLACLAEKDTLARLGGDEFAVLVPAGSPSVAENVADRIVAAIKAPFLVESSVTHTDVSVGIARYPADAETVEELLSNAGLALYQAKAEGRGCRRLFTIQLRDTATRRRAFEGELRRAFDEGEFVLHYQPQVDLADGRMVGVEALLRWQHPSRGLLAPGAFLPALAGGILAEQVGTWTIEAACAQVSAWRRLDPSFRVGVNLFEAQFRTGDLHRRVQEVLRRTGLPAEALELEVTENIILRQDATMLEALRALHDLGVSIAFDDFGTGYASLSMLKAYPLSRLKIDRSFVINLADDPTDAVIVSAVAMLGRGLGLDVIAEGIETEQQRDLLRACGCTSGQGYLFGRPMAADDLTDLIAADLASRTLRLSA